MQAAFFLSMGHVKTFVFVCFKTSITYIFSAFVKVRKTVRKQVFVKIISLIIFYQQWIFADAFWLILSTYNKFY